MYFYGKTLEEPIKHDETLYTFRKIVFIDVVDRTHLVLDNSAASSVKVHFVETVRIVILREAKLSSKRALVRLFEVRADGSCNAQSDQPMHTILGIDSSQR